MSLSPPPSAGCGEGRGGGGREGQRRGEVGMDLFLSLASKDPD